MPRETNLEYKSPLQQFYAGQNILITGGTGFLGKVLIEKLLRSCPDLLSIYVIIRPKKGCDAYQRLDSLLNGPMFDKLRKQNPDYRNKIKAIGGDCSNSGLGLSKEDRNFIIQEVSIVFNVAATVRFNEKLKQAVSINVNGPREIIHLCQNIKNLKSLVHVSTAFSNCIRKEIDECFYTSPMTGDDVIKLVQILDDKKLDYVTKTLLGDFPNTYTYTKNIAEQVIREFGQDLPVGIFRPAIVVSGYHEPIPGWIDNYFGPTGLLAGGGAGILRTLHLDLKCTAEVVPVDLTVNALIATAWDVANNKKQNEDPPIFNYISSWNNSLQWGKYIDLAMKYGENNPTIHSIWYYFCICTKNVYVYHLLTFLLHIIPALFLDFILFAVGKETRLLKSYKKLHTYMEVTNYFGLNNWKFSNLNTRILWDKLSSRDQEIFDFSMKDFDWEDYMLNCIRGIRLFIFKDNIDTIPMARKRMKRFFILHTIIKYTLFGFLLWLLYSIISVVMTMGTNIGFTTMKRSIDF